jgi:hypothetical protein
MSQFNVDVLVERETFATTFEPIQLNLGWHLKRLKSQGLPPLVDGFVQPFFIHHCEITKQLLLFLSTNAPAQTPPTPQKCYDFFYVSC